MTVLTERGHRKRRLWLIAFLAIVAVCLVWVPGSFAAPDVEELIWDLQVIPLDGQDAIGFTLVSLEGKKISLSGLHGRAVLLYFWATW